jgi:hypothetical protein
LLSPAISLRGLPKDDDQQASRKGSQKRREQTHDEDRHVAFIGERQNRILAKKPLKADNHQVNAPTAKVTKSGSLWDSVPFSDVLS